MLIAVGGGVLALIAGYLNAALLALGHPAVTHVTGAISRLSADLGRANLADLQTVLPISAAFCFGAMLSGVILGSATLRLARPYGLTILVEAGLVACAAGLLDVLPGVAVACAAAAAGVQNAMASSYAGLIIRTTHVTGIVTDLGFLLGRRLRGRKGEAWKALFLTTLLASFVVGGVAGTLVADAMGRNALWLIAGVLGVGGIGVRATWRFRKTRGA